MGNVSNNAYALTCLCPIQKGHIGGTAYSDEVRHRLQNWGLNEMSPMAKVCLLYTSPSPRDQRGSRMPSSA